MTGAGTREDPFAGLTAADIDTGVARYRHCRCGDCEEVGLCTPRSDYFASADGVFRCEPCFDRYCETVTDGSPVLDLRTRREA